MCDTVLQFRAALGLTTAVTPEEAAVPFAEFVDKLDMSMTGKHWAPSEWLVTSRV